MPTYNARCPKCQREEEYESKIAERELQLPRCEPCGVKMEPAVIGNVSTGFILKGKGWFKSGGY